MTDYRTYLDRQGVPKGPWVTRDSDRSGEAGETPLGGSTEGESAVPVRAIAQVPPQSSGDLNNV